MTQNPSDPVQKLAKAMFLATSDFFDEDRSPEVLDEGLQFLFTHLSKVIYCCMDEDIQLAPDTAAKAMGKNLEKRVISTAHHVNKTKKLLSAMGIDPLSMMMKSKGDTLQ